MTQAETINRQSEIIRTLFAERDKLQRELAEEKNKHQEDVAFLKRVIAAALDELPARQVVVRTEITGNVKFVLLPNLGNDMIVRMLEPQSVHYDEITRRRTR